MTAESRGRLSPTQWAFATTKSPFPAFVGGFGSGKTAAAIARTMNLKVAARKQNVAYYLPTFPLVEDIAFTRFPEMLEKHRFAYTLNRNSGYIQFPDAGKIIFRTMERPERIVGYEVAHSIADELDTLGRDKAQHVWNKIIARNRQKCGFPNSVGVVTTPEGFKFVWERWVKNKAPGYELFKARTIDNAANLPDGYIENLTNTYPPALLLAYLEGEFVNLTAMSVYAEFDRSKNSTFEIIRPGEPLHIGMDFNVGHMAALVCVVRHGLPYALDEFTEVFDTPAMIEAIKTRYPGHSIQVYPDASGGARKTQNASQSDLSLLRQAHFSVLSAPSNPAIKDRILAMNRMISSNGGRRFFVNPDMCPAFVEALEKQAYDKNGLPDKQSGHDHINDAAGYFIFYRYPVISRNVKMIELGGI